MMKGLFCFQMPFEGFFLMGASKKAALTLLFLFFNSSLYLFLTILVCFVLPEKTQKASVMAEVGSGGRAPLRVGR